jgi:very-short-patch-repair endonuclease
MTSQRTTNDDGISTLAMLEARGVGASQRSDLLRSGALIRLRNGWFARPGADAERSRAVRVGGRISCMTALRQVGLWVMPDSRLHIAVAPNASRLRCPDDRHRRWDPEAHPDIRLHWTDESDRPPESAAADAIETSITHLVRCVDRNSAIVTIDSALNTITSGRPVLTMRQLRAALEPLARSHGRILELVDGSSQSGLETLARLRLRSHGIRVQTQVSIDGVGRVDVLIGDRLVLELDSRSHHLGDGYETDRTRDLELFRQGFIVIRVSYRRVMFDWQSVEDAIVVAVRRGDHRWRHAGSPAATMRSRSSERARAGADGD